METEEPWIEDVDDVDDDDDDNHNHGFDLFATPSPKEFQIIVGENTTLTVSGIVQIKFPHLLQSTGLTLWKGSENLCKFLSVHTEYIRGKHVVELGAGLGLCGILAHKLGAQKVILTDGDTDTLSNMRHNIASNVKDEGDDSGIICKQLLWGRNVETFCQKWAAAPDHAGFDVVMGGDIAYAQEALEPLFATVLSLLSVKPASVFLLSFVFRNGVTMESVFECAERNGLRWLKPEHEGTDGVYVFHRVIS